MSISVACPACGRQYTVKDDAAGKRFKCKDCEEVVEVPADGAGFTDDEFGEPYAPYGTAASGESMPAPARRGRPGAGTAASTSALERTKLPAIFMFVVCAISLGYWLLNIVSLAAGFQGPMPELPDPQQQAQMEQLSQGIGFVMSAVLIFKDLYLVYAFSRMLVGRSYGLAFAGAVISVIPCVGSPCCALGIPFGIWALVVLKDPAVKASFR